MMLSGSVLLYNEIQIKPNNRKPFSVEQQLRMPAVTGGFSCLLFNTLYDRVFKRYFMPETINNGFIVRDKHKLFIYFKYSFAF